MDLIADLGENYSHDEIRVTHEQNLVLPNVRTDEVYSVWQELVLGKLATPNIGLITDMITCPGLDYCNLANARSIPVAQNIAKSFEDIERQHDRYISSDWHAAIQGGFIWRCLRMEN